MLKVLGGIKMKSKLRILVVCFFVMLTLTACANLNDPVPDEDNFKVYVGIEPKKDVTGEPQYVVYGGIYDKDDEIADSEFNNAVITVNDIVVGLWDNNDGHFRYEGDDLVLQAGDIVNIKVDHSLLGKIEESIEVPAVVEQMSTDVNPEEFTNDSGIKDLTLNWDPVETDAYIAWIKLYRADEETPYYFSGPVVFENYHTYTRDDLAGYGEEADYISFSLTSMNLIERTGTYGQISFEVWSLESPELR